MGSLLGDSLRESFRLPHVTKKEVEQVSIQARSPLRVRDVRSHVTKRPHPNPPLGKGRGPEVQLIVRGISIEEEEEEERVF
ncbi:hypothetical protein NG799_26280 [Laspinema sp. D1]|uniref:Uncharacterized protein n=1 Tax=Laspinema palackyanum D2a TaxID=2953684 RepID=A0ABT2MZ62_9CYAN|nr:hypothetical protein [Laspinema sp. D2b]MCT7969827.1 hypothetical protein [Laspinema sp. D2a]